MSDRDKPELESCCGGSAQATRRFFLLAAGAVAVGVAAGVFENQRAKEVLVEKGGVVGPATTEPLGAPDLGNEVFPDPTGKADAQISDAPVIVIPRDSWTHQKPDLKNMVLMGMVNKITVHHTAMFVDEDNAWKPTVHELNDVEGFHTGKRGWADIAYHYAVDGAGRVWQARPLVYQGAHVKGHNPNNLGIVLIGNFNRERPSAAQLYTLTHFLEFVRGLYHVEAGQVFTHGELGQTDCPGKSLQAFMNRLRSKWA